MNTLEKAMQEFFLKSRNDNKTNIFNNENSKDKIYNEKELIPVVEDRKTDNNSINNSNLKIPFAFVNLVAENSPAQEAGLLKGDALVTFDTVLYYGVDSNPLKKIAEIINKKQNHSIPIEIVRKSSNTNESEYINITLIPHSWDGQGLLG